MYMSKAIASRVYSLYGSNLSTDARSSTSLAFYAIVMTIGSICVCTHTNAIHVGHVVRG